MSDASNSESEGHPALVKNCTIDAVVAALIFALGTVVVLEAERLGAGWTADGPGSGYFPFYIGLIVCLSALGVFYQAVFSKAKDTGGFVNREELGRVLSVLIPAVVYVFAMVFLGIYVASAIYITVFMIVLGKYPPVKSVLLGVAVNVFFFLMFEVWFKVPLYKGTLDLLGFTGY